MSRGRDQTITGPGRPKYCISEDTLVHFRELGYSWKQISAMLLVSRWTVYRRVQEMGTKEVTGYTNLSDDELDVIIDKYKKSHGLTVGRSLVMGHLRSINIRVQQRRVTKSLVRLDPVNARIRWA